MPGLNWYLYYQPELNISAVPSYSSFQNVRLDPKLNRKERNTVMPLPDPSVAGHKLVWCVDINRGSIHSNHNIIPQNNTSYTQSYLQSFESCYIYDGGIKVPLIHRAGRGWWGGAKCRHMDIHADRVTLQSRWTMTFARQFAFCSAISLFYSAI